MASESENKTYFGGVEGGGTGSNLVILDETGKEVAVAECGSTNQWLIGTIPLQNVAVLFTLPES